MLLVADTFLISGASDDVTGWIATALVALAAAYIDSIDGKL